MAAYCLKINRDRMRILLAGHTFGLEPTLLAYFHGCSSGPGQESKKSAFWFEHEPSLNIKIHKTSISCFALSNRDKNYSISPSGELDSLNQRYHTVFPRLWKHPLPGPPKLPNCKPAGNTKHGCVTSIGLSEFDHGLEARHTLLATSQD